MSQVLFSSMSRGGGYDQFIRWLHAWEGMSGSLSADGTKYIIGDDGYGNITVGYGVDIFNGGFAERFAAAGYPQVLVLKLIRNLLII